MKRYSYSIFLLSILILGCQNQDQQTSEVQRIIDEAIAAHGGTQLDNTHINFDFRKRHYEVDMHQGKYRYESFFEDSIGSVHDVLDNEGFSREVNNQRLNLSEEDKSAYQNSLNSVIYFALLPYFLNDAAVNKKLLGETVIKGEPYHEILVTFDQDGGGKDHEDVYVYWIHQQNKTMDYLAYSYHVNEGGTRYREAYNVREIEGIRFADYVNYESTEEDFKLEDYETLFEAGKVKEFSKIDLRNIEVSPEAESLASVK